jgi:hypothetical protein
MNRLQINRVWSAEALRPSNKTSIFLCKPGEVRGQWIHMDTYVSIKKLVKKYKATIAEILYEDDVDYTLHYLITRP